MPPFAPAARSLRPAFIRASNLGSNVNPAASTNATAAVLTTSDSNAARNDDRAHLEAGVRCANSTGERRGRSSDTARLEADRSSAAGGKGEFGAAADVAAEMARRLLLLAIVDIVPADDADRATMPDFLREVKRDSELVVIRVGVVVVVVVFVLRSDEGENALVRPDWVIIVKAVIHTQKIINWIAVDAMLLFLGSPSGPRPLCNVALLIIGKTEFYCSLSNFFLELEAPPL